MKSVTSEQIKNRILFENPWLEPPNKIQSFYLKFRQRTYLNLLYPLVKDTKTKRAIVLMGPRRVGKTVLIHHVINKLLTDGIKPKQICYISVDHPIFTGLSLEQLINYFTQVAKIDMSADTFWVLFDEIQYRNGWELHLKKIVDSYPNIKCLASGSAAAALKLKSIESGAGRFTDFLLPPLTFHEYLFLQDMQDIVTVNSSDEGESKFYTHDIDLLNQRFLHYINFGGYPEVIFSPEIQADPVRFIKNDIIDKVLLRDLPSLYGIQDIQELNHLFTTLAFNTANEVSLESISQGSGLAKNTIKRYIEYLEAAFLIKCVHRVDDNSRRFRRANFFKVYLTNPSIRAALFEPVTFNDGELGDLVETAIFSQWFHSLSANIYYARWHNGEVDIVNLQKKNQKVSWAVETKFTDRAYTHPKSELKSLFHYCEINECVDALVTTKTISKKVKIDKLRIEYIPASLYCYLLGYNIVRAKANFSDTREQRESWQKPLF